MIKSVLLAFLIVFIIFILFGVDIEIERKKFLDYSKNQREAITVGDKLLQEVPCSKKLLKSYLKSKEYDKKTVRVAIRFLNVDEINNAKRCVNLLYKLETPISLIWDKLEKYGFSERTIKKIFTDWCNQLSEKDN